MKKPSSRTAAAMLKEISIRDPSREVLVDGQRRWSYGSFSMAVRECAGALLALGVRHGDRVGILAGNRAEWLITNFAIMSIGAISVGLNTWSSANELAYQLKNSGLKILFLEEKFRDRNFLTLLNTARGIAETLPALETIIVYSERAPAAMHTWDNFIATAGDVSATSLDAAVAQVNPGDIACMLYTSGSTALPKGVPLLHQGLIENMWEIGERQRLVADDRVWLAVSLFWSLACVNAVFAVLSHGGTIVLQRHFDAGAALQIIEAEACTIFYGTPNMALAMAEHTDLSRRDLATLRTGVTIGTAQQIERVHALGVNQICNVYGLTEAYGNSTVTDATLPLAKRLETVGQALPGIEVSVVDALTGEPQPADVVGEILLRGNVTPGYWNDAERTAEAFTKDGWFRTGDLGLLDENGFLYYRGRLKEMVKTGGINVAPAEVEQALSTHSAIELAFVTRHTRRASRRSPSRGHRVSKRP